MQSDQQLNDSTTSRSDVKNHSAFMAQKFALKEESELETLRKRLRRIQLDQEKKAKQNDNLVQAMNRLKNIYDETSLDRQQKKQRREQENQQAMTLHEKAQVRREKIDNNLKSVRQSIQSLRRQEMLEVLEQRRKHEEAIKLLKEEELEKKRKMKEEVQKMLNHSRERTHIFFVDKKAKQIETKQTEIEGSQSKVEQMEQQMLKIRLEEERQRKRLQIIAESATNAKKQIMLLPKHGNSAVFSNGDKMHSSTRKNSSVVYASQNSVPGVQISASQGNVTQKHKPELAVQTQQ